MDDISEALGSAVHFHQAGQLREAERLYREILARQPAHHEALSLLGIAALQQARPAEAVELISRAVNIAPENAAYLTHLGNAYIALQQWDQAAEVLGRAVAANPKSADAHFSLGVVERKQDQIERAAASFERAIVIDPARVEAHYNLANAWKDLGRFDDAERCYREAIRLRPDLLIAANNLGNVLRSQGRFEEAEKTLRQVVAREPNFAPGYLNLGTVLGDLGHYDEAIACFSRALAIDPGFALVHDHMGVVLQAAGRFDEALASHEQALRLDPQLIDAHFNRAMVRLRFGDFERGWTEYEWRWKLPNFTPFSGPQPRWDGSPFEGRTILLQAEQGMGDTLHFVRYAQFIRDLGGRVVLECQPALVRLLAAACPALDAVVPLGGPRPAFDVYAPLLSLPGIFGTTLSNIPAPQAYLSADPALVDHWRRELVGVDGFRVGIMWQGNPRYPFDRLRSIALDEFAALARVANVRLISLQKHDGAEQLAAVRDRFEVVDLGPNFDEAAGPFMDSAAVMKNLDLVVTADTAAAHLAGALGVPVWVALRVWCDWRWLIGRQDTPWYPTMRLFRQQTIGQWADVFQVMAAALAPLAAR